MITDPKFADNQDQFTENRFSTREPENHLLIHPGPSNLCCSKDITDKTQVLAVNTIKITDNHRENKFLCTQCSSTASESLSDSSLNHQTISGLISQQAHRRLLDDLTRLKLELELSKKEKYILMQENSQLKTGNNLLRKQIQALPETLNYSMNAKLFEQRLECEVIVEKSQAAFERKANFLYNKIEDYIVRVSDLEFTISDFRYELDKTTKKYKNQMNTLENQLSAAFSAKNHGDSSIALHRDLKKEFSLRKSIKPEKLNPLKGHSCYFDFGKEDRYPEQSFDQFLCDPDRFKSIEQSCRSGLFGPETHNAKDQ